MRVNPRFKARNMHSIYRTCVTLIGGRKVRIENAGICKNADIRSA